MKNKTRYLSAEIDLTMNKYNNGFLFRPGLHISSRPHTNLLATPGLLTTLKLFHQAHQALRQTLILHFELCQTERRNQVRLLLI